MYCIYFFLHLNCLPLLFFTIFQFLPSSGFTQRAKPGSRASLPACAATLRASPVHSLLGWRTAWTSQPSYPNSSPCKVRRSQEFTAHCMYTYIFLFLLLHTFTATIALAAPTTKINVTIIAFIWLWLLSLLQILLLLIIIHFICIKWGWAT